MYTICFRGFEVGCGEDGPERAKLDDRDEALEWWGVDEIPTPEKLLERYRDELEQALDDDLEDKAMHGKEWTDR